MYRGREVRGTQVCPLKQAPDTVSGRLKHFPEQLDAHAFSFSDIVVMIRFAMTVKFDMRFVG